MVEKLRRKYIWITMVAVVCVLTIIMGSVILFNYIRVCENADEVLDVLIQNDGKFDQRVLDMIGRDQGIKFGGFAMSQETQFETRYFTVRVNDGLYITDTTNIRAVSSTEAADMAKEVLDSGSTKGYSNGVYRYKVSEKEDGTVLIVFVDCTRQLDSVYNFLWISILVSFAGAMGVLCLVAFVSRKVFAPIAENMEQQKRFITEASHELKTPLTIISANNEIIEMEHGESESTHIIARQVSRMTSMVKNLTALARIDEAQYAGKITTTINISNVISDLAGVFRNALENNNRQFICNIIDGVNIKANEGLIRQLISVLFENSSKYAKTKTVFDMKVEGKKLIMQIANDAICVNSGNLDECFERFYRSPEARASSVEGSGIGLSMAKEIVELHKGTIRAFGSGDGIFNIVVELPL